MKKPLDPGIGSTLYTELMKEKHPVAELLLAGEVARIAGVSTDTLRHYERKGVLPRPSRSANGYRRYTEESINRVRLIRRALDVGFTLDELADILKERDRGGAPCRRVRELAAGKLNELEDRLKELVQLRDELRRTLSDWDERLSSTKVGTSAGLLESLTARDQKGRKRRKDVSRRNKPTKKRGPTR